MRVIRLQRTALRAAADAERSASEEAKVATNFYYVYALKDPRSSPAKPFYVGKGTGSRAYDHLVTPDRTRKYARIREIIDSAVRPLISLRLPESLLNELKVLANQRDVPYQSLLKIFLAERVETERRRKVG
jgi:hypothetical protein